MPDPRQGEVWWVKFDPVVGSEIRKTRPAIVISRNSESHLGMLVVVPLTTWGPRFARHRSKVHIPMTAENGLSAPSAADLMQVRGVSRLRLESRLGVVAADDFAAVLTALQYVTGIAP